MPVGCAPNRQEADNRNSSACSQRAESYCRPKKGWKREKEKSRIQSRSKFIKNIVADRKQTKKENTCLQVAGKPRSLQALNSVPQQCDYPQHNNECRQRVR